MQIAAQSGGGLYVAGAGFLKFDSSSMMEQFLTQVGASAIASYLAEPLMQMASKGKK